MKKIIADSGGTKTDWCIVDATGNRNYLTTRSYHPNYINELFISEERSFWFNLDLSDFELHFFCSGCFSKEKSQEMKSALEAIGFTDVIVKSDIHGAAFALNILNGWGAICGTGSVVFEIKEGEIVCIYGGSGFEEGDEGSGFYFGKLVVEAIKNGNLEYGQISIYIEKEFSEHEVLNPMIDSDKKKIYSRLPYMLRELDDFDLVKSIHHNNIRIFAEKYLAGCNKISIAGSYAFYHQHHFRNVLSEFDIEVVDFLERPIERLTDYIQKTTVK